MIAWLDLPEDRAACYAVKRAAGDTIVCLALSGQYHEGDRSNAMERIPGKDFSQNLPALHALIVEALTVGGMRGINLMLAGDGEGAGPGYNDPGGMTYGFDWLMANFPRVYGGLQDLADFISWHAGFDGWIPGWQPWSKVNQWLTFARSVIGPTGHLGIYLSAGYWAWSGEHNDYAEGAGREVDQVLVEFPYPMGPPTSPVPADFMAQSNDVRAPFDQVWQISKRLLGSRYRRPADQPADDDPGQAPDLPATARGPVVVVAREYNTYGDVRGLDPAITAQRRAYLKAIGWHSVG